MQTVNVHLNWVQNGSKELLFDPWGIKLDWVQTVKAVARKKNKEKKKWNGGVKGKIVFWQYVNVFSISKPYLLTPFLHVALLDFLITDLNDVLFRADLKK